MYLPGVPYTVREFRALTFRESKAGNTLKEKQEKSSSKASLSSPRSSNGSQTSKVKRKKKHNGKSEESSSDLVESSIESSFNLQKKILVRKRKGTRATVQKRVEAKMAKFGKSLVATTMQIAIENISFE